ncbi:MAG: sugar ABC transporter ATP-binding protein [Oscillospiraceae bacterium]|nr:sugar ABC transporter ATP-binding protein [Oscillospiraceae bacterium]
MDQEAFPGGIHFAQKGSDTVMAQSLLKAVDVKKSFAGVNALKGINLEIYPGEIHCLAGENGCGKSTLIKVISGVYTPTSGHIEMGGKSYNKITPIEAIMNGVQVIYQDFSIFPNLSVMENLAFNSELADKRKLVNKKRMRQIAQDAIAKINFDVDLDEKVGALSVANKQLVAICRALMFNAKLIIMDEPTTALTRKEVNALFQIILDLKAQGIAILFVSHKLDEVFEISERFTIMRSGELVATGNTAELDDKKFTYYMTGREIEDLTFTPENVSEEPVLEVQNLKLDGYFDNINFSLKRGEILSITGLLGSGRTELALTLFGMRKADGGTIRIDGKDVILNAPDKAIENGIGYVPEDRLTEGLFLPRSIGDNAVIAEIDKLAGKLGLLADKTRRDEGERLIRRLSVATPDANNACNTLSGGNQQRVVLAKWLAIDLKVLILNGPTVGVDIGSKRDIHEILHNLAKEGLGIIIISDDLPEILANSSDILIMRGGEITASLKPSETNVAELSGYMM